MNTLTRKTRESDRSQAEQFITPPASVTEIADGYMLEIEMPGVKKDGLEISVEDNELTIIGRRSLPVVEGTLIDQGLVTLTLRKAEHVKPRKITVL